MSEDCPWLPWLLSDTFPSLPGVESPTPFTTDERRLLAAALQLCGREDDGTWVVYGDEHGDVIREHLLPVVREIVEAHEVTDA